MGDSTIILNIGAGDESYGDVRVDIYEGSFVDVICDAEFLPFRDLTFTEVYSRNLIEHLKNPFNCIKEMHRVLRSGGEVFLITDNANWSHALSTPFSKGQHALGGYSGRGSKDRHFALYTPEHLYNFLELAGLIRIKVSCTTEGADRPRILRLIDRMLHATLIFRSIALPYIKAIARK